MRTGSGFFQHGHTYLGHPVACAAALAVQNVIRDCRLLAQVKVRGSQLQESLDAAFKRMPVVEQYLGDLRGRGLLWGVELVQSKETKKPFDPKHQLHIRIKREAMLRGLLVYPMGGTVDGQFGDHVLLAPPYITSEVQIDEISHLLVESIWAAIQSI